MAKIIRQSFIGHKPENENSNVDIELLKQRIGERIRFERKKLGLTIEQFSELNNISSSFLGLVERGERLMSITTIYSLSKKLNLPISYILGENNGIPKGLWFFYLLLAIAFILGVIVGNVLFNGLFLAVATGVCFLPLPYLYLEIKTGWYIRHEAESLENSMSMPKTKYFSVSA